MNDQIFQVNCGFFDSVNSDRLYSANEMNRPYKRIISNGVFATPQGTPSTDLQVVSASNAMNIIVNPGEGLFAGKWFENPATIAITVPNNTSVVPRMDSVIVQIDNRQSGRVGNIVYRQGTASSNPQPPAINTVANVSEYRLANIYVAPNANAINNDAITDCRPSSECGWITSLIQQVDTSVLFEQWQYAYENYYNNSTNEFNEYTEEQREAWEQFLENLTSELTVATNVIMLTNNYVSQGTISNIPIGIPSYNPSTDILMVFVNGLRVTEGLNYTINSNNTSIDLKVALTSGQAVNFLVLKSVIAADIQTTVTMIQDLNNRLSNYMSDTGWITFTLENGATAYNTNLKPQVRSAAGRVYLQGAIKGLTAKNKTICTLPVNLRPSMDYYFTTVAMNNNGQINDTITIKVGSNGYIQIVGASGTIASTDMIPLNTNFILN